MEGGAFPKYSEAEQYARAKAGIAHISKQFARFGLTTVHHEGGNFSALMQVRQDGQLMHRVSYEADQPMLDAMIANGWRTGLGDEWICLGATSEHTVDGSFSERTMSIRSGYPNRPDYHGNVTTRQADLDQWVERVWRAGIQPNCHTNGDIAIDMYLTALERAQRLFPRRDVRPKFTHSTLAYPDLDRPDESARRSAGAVHQLCLLQPRQVQVLWRRPDGTYDALSLLSRRRNQGGRRVRFSTRDRSRR